MEELTIEQKAKRYDEAIKIAKSKIKNDKDHVLYEEDIIEIFHELKKKTDEEMIQKLITVCHLYYGEGVDAERDECLEWLEKQGEIDKAQYDIAEKEKYDFVSDQFIECRKSFDVFKEDNSYWFEYISNDNYIGRSDNILNQKFHITPRQLYRLFTQQHCPKENNINEES